MTPYETIKAAVTTRQAAQLYGLEVNRNGMSRCPCHEDHTPSLMLDNRYYCFGCHATGDVIDFTARLFGTGQYHAAKKLAEDFGLNPRPPTQSHIPHPRAEPPITEQFCIFVLREYLRLLNIWKLRYAPENPQEEIDDRFAEACQMTVTVEHLLDALYDADPQMRHRAVGILSEGGRIYDLQAYVTRKKKEEGNHERKRNA